MDRIPTTILTLAAALALALASSPTVSAGTADAPEVTDAAGDCAFAPANEYADIVAAWVSDETATSLNVNLALNKWTADALAEFTGYAVQFEHQGKQFGIAAFYGQGGWAFSNGYIDTETGETADFTDAEGSFTPGTPALITVVFDKSHFPHDDPTDNGLRNFQAATADFKQWVPFFFVPAELPAYPPWLGGCDIAESDATYTFTTGGHSMPASTGNETSSTTGATSGGAPAQNATTDDVSALRSQAGGPSDGNDTPAPGFALLLASAALVAALRRRRA